MKIGEGILTHLQPPRQTALDRAGAGQMALENGAGVCGEGCGAYEEMWRR